MQANISKNDFFIKKALDFLYHFQNVMPYIEIQGAAAISVKYTRIRKNNTAQLIMIRFY
jgi:hypothetical protein